MLRASDKPLTEFHDLAMLDLDGVVYVGAQAVPGAVEAIAVARSRGMRTAYVTNNAARSPESVAAHLVDLGVPAAPADVVTSSQAAARLLRDRFGAGARVFLAGGPGVEAALLEVELVPVTGPGPAAAVLTGFGPDLPWHRIMQAAVLVRSGVPWVATNADLTFPMPEGPAPGHGAVVRMIEEFSGVAAVVAGKPQRPLLDETARRAGALRPLMVGDRLDTDIEGAHNAGMDSLLVLTGVSGIADLVTAAAASRPSYIASGLAGLLVRHEAPVLDGSSSTLGGWAAEVVDGSLVVRGSGLPDDWWRVAVTAAWRHLDDTGVPARLTRVMGSVPWCP